MTIEEAPFMLPIRKWATVIGISKAKLYAMVGDGTLKARYVGRFMRLHKDDVLAMLNALPKVVE